MPRLPPVGLMGQYLTWLLPFLKVRMDRYGSPKPTGPSHCTTCVCPLHIVGTLCGSSLRRSHNSTLQ